MSQQPHPPQQKKPETMDYERQKAIWTEAKGAHSTAKQILDLLASAAMEGEPTDPLQEIRDLLGQIVNALANQAQQIQTLEAHILAIREGRGRLGKHAGSPP